MQSQYVSKEDHRIRRWALDVDERQIFEDDEEIARQLEDQMRGRCGWIKRCFYDCKREKV